MPGSLYICATPIGNLGDITYRVVDTLKQADLIAAEDTRNSMKLMTHFDIHTPLTSYHEHNKFEKAAQLVEKMLKGADVALITDAGTPAISDPGEELVRQAISAGIEVTSLPGACACVTALAMSGLPAGRFAFEAFLPRTKKERDKILSELENETRTIIIYESPHRLVSTLRDLSGALGDRPAVLCREMTKAHEEKIYTTIDKAVKMYADIAPRGEYVLVIAGRDKKDADAADREKYDAFSIKEHVDMYMSQGFDKKEAMKLAAKDRGVPKREIYNGLLDGRQEGI